MVKEPWVERKAAGGDDGAGAAVKSEGAIAHCAGDAEIVERQALGRAVNRHAAQQITVDDHPADVLGGGDVAGKLALNGELAMLPLAPVAEMYESGIGFPVAGSVMVWPKLP